MYSLEIVTVARSPRTLSLLNSYCTPLAFVLAGVSTNSTPGASLCLFSSHRSNVPKPRGQGHAGSFHKTVHLKRPTTH